jgi:hypothetical protein
MEQPIGKLSKSYPLLIALLITIIILLSAFLIVLTYTPPDNSPDNTVSNSPVGSISENVEGINEMVLVAPEYDFVGTLAALLACFAAFGVVARRRRRLK